MKGFQSMRGVLELWECFRGGRNTMHLRELWWRNRDEATGAGWGGRTLSPAGGRGPGGAERWCRGKGGERLPYLESLLVFKQEICQFVEQSCLQRRREREHKRKQMWEGWVFHLQNCGFMYFCFFPGFVALFGKRSS